MRERDPEDQKKNLVTPVDDLIALCKHDKLKQLKGLPKIFIVQACSGEDIVMAAGGEQADCDEAEEEEDEYTLQLSLPIDADWFYAAAATKR